MKKNDHIVIGTSKIEWAIDESCPKYRRLASLKDLALVNPLYYQSQSMETKLFTTERHSKINDKYIVTTNGLIFKKYCEQINYEVFKTYLNSFINHLRIISKQAINSNNYLHFFTNININDLERSPDFENTKNMFIRGDIYSTLITWDMLIEADRRVKSNYQIPIYIEILTDALNGLMNHDYRKTILYCSIAMESMFSIELDKKYQQIIAQNKNSKKYRVTEFSTANGLIYKDPVYQKLSEGTNFSNFLHERALYILNKSLLIEDENLYNNAKKLYSTRNKIVHLGEPINPTNQYLTIDYSGAKEAFLIARKIFKWMGITEFDSVLLDTFIEIK